jgi:hypothetical protein
MAWEHYSRINGGKQPLMGCFGMSWECFVVTPTGLEPVFSP